MFPRSTPTSRCSLVSKITTTPPFIRSTNTRRWFLPMTSSPRLWTIRISAAGALGPPAVGKTNAASRVGDVLILTRPIGIGIMTTAVKTGNLSPAGYVELLENITTLNKVGSWLGKQRGVHAMTDITGFGLAGHLLEMAKGARVRMRIQASAVPVMEEAWSLVVEGGVPPAAHPNMNGYADSISS